VHELEEARKHLESQGEEIRPADVLLLRTDWSERAIGEHEYFRNSPGLTQEAAQWLVDKAPKCIGCDFFEEPAARQPGWTPDQFVVHRTILGAGMPLVEGLVNLGELPSRCTFFAPFYKFEGVESAPARAFAMVQ
jgi:kynurenine formamidase